MVTGAGGALGTDLARLLRADGEQVTALTRAELDISDADAVERAVAAWAGADRAGEERAGESGVTSGVTTTARCCSTPPRSPPSTWPRPTRTRPAPPTR